MRTRNSSTPQSAPSAKKTPPGRKAAAAAAEAKTPLNPADPEVGSPQSATKTKRTPMTRAKLAKAAEAASSTQTTSPIPSTNTAAAAPEAAVEEAKATSDTAVVTPGAKPSSGTKTTRRVVRKVVRKTVVRVPKQMPKTTEAGKVQVEDVESEKDVEDEGKVEAEKQDAEVSENVEEPRKGLQPSVGNVKGSVEHDREVVNVEESTEKEDVTGLVKEPLTENVVKPSENIESMVTDERSLEYQQPSKVEPLTENVVKPSDNIESMVTDERSLEYQQPSKVEEEVELKEEEKTEDRMDMKTEELKDQKLHEPVDDQKLEEEVEFKEEEKTDDTMDMKAEEFEDQKLHEPVNDQKLHEPIDDQKLEEEVELKEEEKTEDSMDMKPEELKDQKLNKPVDDKVESQSGTEEEVELKEEAKAEDSMDMKVEELKDQILNKPVDGKVESQSGTVKMDEDVEEGTEKVDAYLEESGEEKIECYADEEDYGQDDFVESDVPENAEETEALEEERAQLDAVTKERQLRKELEIFVGGLERDATEDDVKKVFQYAGEVVEVRLHKDPSTNKNKGYAFVRFATKEQAIRALSEMKNPVIHGKRCGTAPADDNDTLFLGNICNTWTKEAVKQKLKDYGIEGVERITLVEDPRHEGLSRGFAFVEFSSHGEAMFAYKRLQKPDAIFGHSERTAKVAFAEPLREPDPEVMAQVKSVFIDGLPPYWDEDRVREKFKDFGEIARIMLARNMSTAKRKDFGFVDFTSHEDALAFVEGVNNTELGDGNAKTRVRARLSNPLPKTQAVKGGMVGGFRIGRGSSGNFIKSGRGFGRGGHSYNRPTFQQGRGFYQHGPGRGGRTGFPNNNELEYPPYHGRQNFGRGGSWGFRGAHQMASGGPLPARPNVDGHRHGAVDRGWVDRDSFRRHQFPYEEGYNRTVMGRRYDDPYLYDEAVRGGKRPFFMTDPDYVEPSRHRARMNYSDPAVSFHGGRSRDAYGAETGPYSQDYYGTSSQSQSQYGRGTYPSYDGAGRSYGHGYYY